MLSQCGVGGVLVLSDKVVRGVRGVRGVGGVCGVSEVSVGWRRSGRGGYSRGGRRSCSGTAVCVASVACVVCVVCGDSPGRVTVGWVLVSVDGTMCVLGSTWGL